MSNHTEQLTNIEVVVAGRLSCDHLGCHVMVTTDGLTVGGLLAGLQHRALISEVITHLEIKGMTERVTISVPALTPVEIRS